MCTKIEPAPAERAQVIAHVAVVRIESVGSSHATRHKRQPLTPFSRRFSLLRLAPRS